MSTSTASVTARPASVTAGPGSASFVASVACQGLALAAFHLFVSTEGSLATLWLVLALLAEGAVVYSFRRASLSEELPPARPASFLLGAFSCQVLALLAVYLWARSEGGPSAFWLALAAVCELGAVGLVLASLRAARAGGEATWQDGAAAAPDADEIASSAQAAGVVTRVSLKFPVIFHLLTLLLVFFAASAEGQAKYDLNAGGKDKKFDLLFVDARMLCLTLAVICALATVHTFYRAWLRRNVSALSAFLAGACAVLGILTWYGADSKANVTLTATLAGGLVLAVPMIYGSLAGIVSERVGIVNIAIEGQLLVGAFAGVVVASATKSVTLGLIAAPVAGALLGSLLAFFAVKYNIDQIIIGVVLNVLALGLTSFFLQAKLEGDSGLNSSGVHLRNIRIPLLADIPVIGPILFKQTLLTYFMYVLVAFLTVYLFRSRWGLRLRACGEHPKAAATVGINVRRTRFLNTMLSGAIAGLGGAFLTIGAAVGQSFNENMSAGRGYIALAAMILGRWHPIGAVGAALVFGLSDAVATLLKSLNAAGASAAYFSMLPYVITILAVAGFVGRSRPPAAENTPYEG